MGYDYERLKVLIVDDNRFMHELLKTILRSFGIKDVSSCYDGSDAITELKHFHADIIITDLEIQLLDGLDFVRLLRTADDSPNRFVPVIMLTGHTEFTHVAAARDVGITEFLAKPVSARRMYERLNAVIEHPRDFVRTTSYAGPDRRRRQDPSYPGPFPRATDRTTVQ
ncbi:MAG: response regulator [Alphaproteobacteria bacterium]|nr:response regulator [Alphaproteobacteria bacterium]